MKLYRNLPHTVRFVLEFRVEWAVDQENRTRTVARGAVNHSWRARSREWQNRSSAETKPRRDLGPLAFDLGAKVGIWIFGDPPPRERTLRLRSEFYRYNFGRQLFRPNFRRWSRIWHSFLPPTSRLGASHELSIFGHFSGLKNFLSVEKCHFSLTKSNFRF